MPSWERCFTPQLPLGPLGSSSSQHRRTLELILQEGSAFFQTQGLKGPQRLAVLHARNSNHKHAPPVIVPVKRSETVELLELLEL